MDWVFLSDDLIIPAPASTHLKCGVLRSFWILGSRLGKFNGTEHGIGKGGKG